MTPAALGVGTRQRLGGLAAALGAAGAVGIAAGVAGVALTLLLHAVQHLAFGYSEDTFLIGVERAAGWRRVAAMAAGGFVVGTGWWWLRRRRDAEEVSVTRALREADWRLPIGPTLADAVLQIIAVGAGASLGREGAPRQAGAALAEALTRHWQLSAPLRRTLMACGAGAGLAAVYNVPVAGVLFALEVLLVSAKPLDAALAAVASGIATVVAWPVLSTRPTYLVAATHFRASLLLVALVLGPVAGLLGVGFVRLTTRARTHAPTGPLTVLASTAAFAAVGALAIAVPELLGNGKGQAQLAFSGLLPLAVAGALALLKPLATATCLAGGAIGGLLTPSLATGAALGAATALVGNDLVPDLSAVGCALIGAAAVLATTQRAPLMAITITIEFVHGGLPLLAPIILAVALGLLSAGVVDAHLRPTWWHAAVGRLLRAPESVSRTA